MTITMPILCSVQNAKYAFLAEDDSLAENMQRYALHPIDQFRAFVALRDKGLNDEEIARVGVFVRLGLYGELAVYRGFVRAEDEPRADVDLRSGEHQRPGRALSFQL